MAKVWPVYEGNRPTIGEPWADIPLSEAIQLFELRQDDFVGELHQTVHFGNQKLDLTFVGFKHIAVELGNAEARRKKWRPGFYKSPVKPKDAFNRLIRQALAVELGKENLVRIDLAPAVDSQGRQALGVIVVLEPDASRKLKGDNVLNALVRLQSRLAEMGDDRIPLVEYTTEAELGQDASP